MEKILTKPFFFNISKQVGKNLIVPSGRGYLVTSKKFFTCLLERASVMNKNLENFQIFQ